LGPLALAIVLPSLVQYLVLRHLVATPHRVKWGERGNAPFFVIWWRAPHHRFTRGQFAAAYCVPGAILCAIVLVYVYTAREAAPVLAFVLPFHLGNFWFASIVLRAPEGTPNLSNEACVSTGSRYWRPVRRLREDPTATPAGSGSAPAAAR
jgi:hypothetical protein